MTTIANPIEYRIHDKSFHSRSDFINYCNTHKKDADFNAASFIYKNFPDKISVNDYVNPILASKMWLQELKKEDKPLVLLFSGGVDSIFALNCMLENNFPPNFILVYTLNPFDAHDIMCSHDMEPLNALSYLKEKISRDDRLKKTKLWHIHLDKNYAEKFFSNDDWLKISGYSYSIESMGLWFDLPKIDQKTIEKYTFIKGGDVPRASIVDGKIKFYIVDLQLGERIDKQPPKCYDFILDNKLLFNSLCVKYAQKIKQNELSILNHASYKNNSGFKYLLDEFSSLMPESVPQLDKRFSESVEHSDMILKSADELLLHIHKTPLKTWLCYLQAEYFQPNWFQNYKKTIFSHTDWIIERQKCPGKISQLIDLT